MIVFLYITENLMLGPEVRYIDYKDPSGREDEVILGIRAEYKFGKKAMPKRYLFGKKR